MQCSVLTQAACVLSHCFFLCHHARRQAMPKPPQAKSRYMPAARPASAPAKSRPKATVPRVHAAKPHVARRPAAMPRGMAGLPQDCELMNAMWLRCGAVRVPLDRCVAAIAAYYSITAFYVFSYEFYHLVYLRLAWLQTSRVRVCLAASFAVSPAGLHAGGCPSS